jgi:molybdopterin synthase sulfur carrier subunit
MSQKTAITITVKFFGGIRHIAGCASLPVPLKSDRSNVGELLVVLRDHMPDVHRAVEKGVQGGYINILLNGRNIRFLQGLATPLTDGAVLAFLPPVGGG